MRLIRAVVRSEGVTALVATHDPTLIDLADEVLLLEDGKITAPVAGLPAQATVVPVVAVRFA
jgi:putative ABC transport system ATP-binding protein